MKKKDNIRILQLAGAVVLLAHVTLGQFAEDALRFSQLGLSVGARSLGMGNATVGSVNDYSALFWNPAGLA
ncbi:MAG: hypothetical protein HW374_1271, partial [Bacteroidetes bacterium]|nr:hypothetical protein [Bacteroidota bacterium]